MEPEPEQHEVEFEIPDEAAAVIRGRGGQLWIWPDGLRRSHATTGPPVEHDAEWVTFRPDGLVVHVDSAIVPPERWVLTAVPGRRWVEARWNGHDPELFGRLPLVRPDDEPVEQPSSPLGHLRKFLLVPGLAWVFAGVWVLHNVGVPSQWLFVIQLAFVIAVAVIVRAIWVREKLRKRRSAKALESHRSLS